MNTALGEEKRTLELGESLMERDEEGSMLLGMLLAWHWRSHFPDDVLIQDLNMNMEKYELLIEMFREDAHMKAIDIGWMRPDNGINETRWEEYKELLEELELSGGISRLSRGDEGILFLSTARGNVTGGSTKGYVYRPEDATPLYPNLDTIPEDLESNVPAFRKINEDWYITFTWDD